MSERTTAEIVAELREWTLPQSSRTWPIAEEAAERLVELTDQVDYWSKSAARWSKLVDVIHANEDAGLA